MKIVCEACQAKYSIADEKVRGKVFKIRCKKCSHVIVVRGGGSAEAGSAPSAEFAASPSSAPDLALDAGWHIVVDGEQVGPLSEGDIRARLARGEINPDTYIWKEGLPDWVKVSTLPEFRGEGEVPSPFSGSGAEAGEADDGFAGSSTMVNQPAAAADVFAGGAAASAGADLFGSPVAAEAGAGRAATGGGQIGYGGYDSPAAPDPFAPMGAAGGNGAGGGMASGGMTGQRHENSVLFSLSNLEALAKPNAAPLPAARSPGAASPSTTTTTEGSGLIDIRAMANMTLGASSARADSRGPDLPAFSAPQFSPVAPVLLAPSHGSSMPRWAIMSLLGGLAVLVIVLAVVAIKLLSREPAPVVTAPPAPVAAPPPVAAKPAAETPPTTPPPAANEELPPREPSKAPVATADKEDRKPGKSAGGTRRPGRGGDSDRAPGVVTPTPRASADPPSAPAPRKPKDDIEALLEQATGTKRSSGSGSSGSAAAARREEEEKPAERLPPLGREDVVRGMTAATPRAHECYNQYKQGGFANIKVTVAPSGRVTAATVTGKFAGTPSGSCVESAVKAVKFVPSAGLTFDYIVPLR